MNGAANQRLSAGNNAPSAAVSLELYHEISQFLYREARLLDAEKYQEWYGLLSEDIHYWMPYIENRRRGDKIGSYQPGRMAYFDDNALDLQRRVARFGMPSCWAEDPATRHLHLISNIEVEATANSNEWIVHSTFINIRGRGELDEDVLGGRREDLIRREKDGLRIARRRIVITQNILNSKNLNTFL